MSIHQARLTYFELLFDQMEAWLDEGEIRRVGGSGHIYVVLCSNQCVDGIIDVGGVVVPKEDTPCAAYHGEKEDSQEGLVHLHKQRAAVSQWHRPASHENQSNSPLPWYHLDISTRPKAPY